MKIVAIHQPNFFPWLGFFNKIVKSDYFVLLDDVQMPKKGGTWTNRVPLIISGKKNWLTIPIDRSYSGTMPINKVKIKNELNWRDKMLKTLYISYKKHPYFSETIKIIELILNLEEEYLSMFNISSLNAIMKHIGTSSDNIYLSSKIPSNGSSNELLVSITKYLSGNIYLYGGGADTYQDELIFKKNGIKLVPQNFNHPSYVQYKQTEFVEGLSIIDCLMNIGAKKTYSIIKK